MASVQVYYKDGDYEEFTSTPLPFQEGYLIQNEFIVSGKLETEGLFWERSFFRAVEGDLGGERCSFCRLCLVEPEDVDKIELIMLNGFQQIYPRQNQEESIPTDEPIDVAFEEESLAVEMDEEIEALLNQDFI